MAGMITNCGECYFYNHKIRKCEHGLLKMFHDRNAKIEFIDSNPIIDRICQYKRSQEWAINNENIDNKLNLCKSEVYIKGTIVIITNNIKDLEFSIKKLSINKNIKNFKFIILYKNITYNNILAVCGNNINIKYKLIQYVDDNIKYQIYKSLKHAINGYLFIIDSSKEFDCDLIDKVNNIVNNKLFRLLHIIGSDGIHESISMIHIYKWLKGDLEIDFKDKLYDISKQESSDAQVFTWKEVNEQYSN